MSQQITMRTAWPPKNRRSQVAALFGRHGSTTIASEIELKPGQDDTAEGLVDIDALRSELTRMRAAEIGDSGEF